MPITDSITLILLVPVVVGSACSVIVVVAACAWFRRPRAVAAYAPPVTVLKPLFGLDRNLIENLRVICTQDYPDYQVVLSAQRRDDPAIPVMREIARAFPERVTVSIVDEPPVRNGKAENLAHALAHARHDVIVISDSDIEVDKTYLREIVAPLADPAVGYVCTLVRAVDARNRWERFAQLSFNADFLPVLVLGVLTRAASFCIGGSTAVRRATIAAIGGFERLAPYMVEDAEMGRRIEARGLRGVFLPRCVATRLEQSTMKSWWDYQVYWDQNARYASRVGFFALPLLKAVPFALLAMLVRACDPIGVAIATGAIALRMLTALAFVSFAVDDDETAASFWLLPLRDVVSVGPWLAALARHRFTRRGVGFGVTARGMIEPLARDMRQPSRSAQYPSIVSDAGG